MRKMTLVLVFILLSIPFSAQAAKWAGAEMNVEIIYEIQNSYCYQLNKIEKEFDQGKYSEVTDEGGIADFQELFSEYTKKLNEYIILNNKVGIIYYESMRYSLKIVAANRFSYPDLEDENYKNAENSLDNYLNDINYIHSRCNCHGE
jgi:hypothetical protein